MTTTDGVRELSAEGLSSVSGGIMQVVVRFLLTYAATAEWWPDAVAPVRPMAATAPSIGFHRGPFKNRQLRPAGNAGG